jgi:DNA-binding MarR family transcriptional regulator
MAGFAQAARRIAKECPGLRAREASRLLSRVFDEALRPVGIQNSQLSVLVAVAMFAEDGANIGALAQALSLDRTTLTRNVQPLEKAGLLRVARSPTDARTRIVVLTRAGERMIDAAYPLWEQARKRIRDSFGGKRVDALQVQLTELVALAPRLGDVER